MADPRPELTAFDAYQWERIVAIQLALIAELDDHDLERCSLVEPGSARLHPEDGGWFTITLGLRDPVTLGRFHRDALLPHATALN